MPYLPTGFASPIEVRALRKRDPESSAPKKTPKRTAKVVEPPKWIEVQSRRFLHYKNAEGMESILVEIIANSVCYRMWMSIIKAKNRADKYWRDHAGNEPTPANVSEWLSRQDELSATAEIMVRPQGKYF